MHDYDSAAWAEHHERVSDGIDRLFRDLLAGFQRLQQRRFDAPWRPATRRPAHR